MPKVVILPILLIAVGAAHADDLSLDDALRGTYVACMGIDDQLADMKKLAGINTAVTGVGTAVGVGATATGLVKASKDKQAADLQVRLDKLREIEATNPDAPAPSEDAADEFMRKFTAARDEMTKLIAQWEQEIKELDAKSKKLGNWRTGLMAGGTATNVAGAVISGINKTDQDLKDQIQGCIAAVDVLQNTMLQARMDGVDISQAESIASACGKYRYVDVSKIDKRARGAMISSIVGATTGAAGTVTSAMANTDEMRNNKDKDKTEKGLNTASNVLAGATAAASVTATVFNATQISAIKKVASVAADCERELSE